MILRICKNIFIISFSIMMLVSTILHAQSQPGQPESEELLKKLINDAESSIKMDAWEAALSHTTQAEAIVNQSTSPEIMARLYLFKGQALILGADYDSASIVLSMGMQWVIKTDNRKLEAQLQTQSGSAARYSGNYEKAAENFLASLRYYESAGDSNGIMENQVEMGIVKFLDKDYRNSEAIFKRALNYYTSTNDTTDIAFAWTLLGLNYEAQEKFDSSITASEESVRLRRAIGDVRGEGESLNNLALAYMGKKDWENALITLEQSKDALIRGRDFRQISVIMGNIGDCLLNLGKSEEAIATYQESIRMSRESGARHDLARVLRKLGNAQESSGDNISALKTYKQYARLKDSLFTEEKAKAIKEMEVKYETESQRNTNTRLIEKAAADKQHKLALIIGLAMVVLISGLLVVLLVMRVRQGRKILDKEKQLFLAKERLQEMELERTRSELSLHINKLDSFKDNILLKNQLIEELEERLKTLEIRDESADRQRLSRLDELLRMKILTDDDWELFKRHFEQVHHGFLLNLRNKLPDLTTGEERLFILLKLNLNSKEISDILGVSPDSVKKARYRLRKKLNLTEEDNLEGYIASFE